MKKLFTRSWLETLQFVPNSIISVVSVVCSMDRYVAEWVQGNYGIDVIWSIIGAPIDVVALKVWLATTIIEWRGFIAAFTYALCSSQNVSRDSRGTMVDVSLTPVCWSLISSVDRSLAEHLIGFRIVCFNDFFKGILAEGFSADQVEDHLLNSGAITNDFYLAIAVIEPFAIKSVFAIFFEEQEYRSTNLHVVADLVVVVSPSSAALRALSVVLVTSIRKKMITVAVFIAVGIGHHNHSVLIVAVADALKTIASERRFYVHATTKPKSYVLMPRHAIPPAYLPEAVSTEAGCIRVKEER
nr:hypothetical protein [Agrobacterium vaccinii]